MSADRWSQCPRCKAGRLAKAKAAQDKATAAYGKVPVEEFDRLRGEVVALFAVVEQDDMPSRTFREDWELTRPDEDGVSIRYSGACEVCDLTLTFEHDCPLP